MTSNTANTTDEINEDHEFDEIAATATPPSDIVTITSLNGEHEIQVKRSEINRIKALHGIDVVKDLEEIVESQQYRFYKDE